MSRRRTIVISAAAGALGLLVAAAPFVPRGEPGGEAVAAADAPAYVARSAEAAGLGTVTPAMRREITRVADADVAVPRVTGRTVPARAVRSLARCATFEGQRYCLGVGWTDRSQAAVRAGLVQATRTARRPGTGDLDAAHQISRLANLAPRVRVRRETAELTQAARSVAKVWLIRHEIQGVPLPAGFLARHPEARVTTTSARAAAPLKLTYPKARLILRRKETSQQERTYWCGPTATQMIVWGWQHTAKSQAHWAYRLGTTTAGTAITDVVRVVNHNTGWDLPSHAGPYIALDISDFTFRQWYKLIEKHISVYKAPVVLHPILLKKYYPYLDHDESGHFQVGRGYNRMGKKPDVIGYFEPWNQQAFDPSRPFIARVQWRTAARSYLANEAHFQHNIGV
jgi:hypothetical protein